MAVEAGTRLGRVVVHEYVGQGTLGTVYRALDAELGTVAVKVLNRLKDPESRERFQETVPRLVDVRHPGLVSVLDHGEHEDVPYVVQEHVDAITLAERFRRATVNPTAALEILDGMAAGIDHAHGEGLVHANLKPVQVMLAGGGVPGSPGAGGDGRPRVLVSDLGLAPLRRPRLAGLAVGFRDGTPEYLAPEQVVGGEPNGATDRYAFAAIAYQLLVDRPPFEGEPQAVMNAQLRSEPVAPSRRNRALPPAVDTVLLRGLAKDQASRWVTCRELVQALARALGAALETAPVEAGIGPTARRWPYVVAGASALAAASLVAGLAVAGRVGQEAPVRVSASRQSVHAGEVVTIDASHLPAGQPGTVQSGPVTVAAFRADKSGRARAQVKIPDGTSPGTHAVQVCWRHACPATLKVRVEPPASQTAAR